MEEREPARMAPVWCIVANIVQERPYGPGGQERRPGTKHFAPGAKVHIVAFFDGETVTVVGRHRRSHRYLTLTTRSVWLVNWRVELVYSPYVIEVLHHHPWTYAPTWQCAQGSDLSWMGSPEAKEKAESMIATLQTWHPTVEQREPFPTRNPQQDEQTA